MKSNDNIRVGVLLSGAGVYDGSELHESVLTLLALDRLGVTKVCVAPDKNQHHVINHITGEEMPEARNVLIESARIARGNIKSLSDVDPDSLDALVIPGGFGTAKNHTNWAFQGAEGTIDPQVKEFIVAFVKNEKPIAALCMAPTTLAKALEDVEMSAHPKLTVGTTAQNSPYDIQEISDGMKKLGAEPVMCRKKDFVVDDLNNIITSPCYMMDTSISEVYEGIQKTIDKLFEIIELIKTS